MTGERDLDREQRFLSSAHRGGPGTFVQHCQARLAEGEERFGSSWAWIGIARHLRELAEEAADLGSWAALADQALDTEPGLTELHRTQIRATLALAAELGAGGTPMTDDPNTPEEQHKAEQLAAQFRELLDTAMTADDADDGIDAVSRQIEDIDPDDVRWLFLIAFGALVRDLRARAASSTN